MIHKPSNIVCKQTIGMAWVIGWAGPGQTGRLVLLYFYLHPPAKFGNAMYREDKIFWVSFDQYAVGYCMVLRLFLGWQNELWEKNSSTSFFNFFSTLYCKQIVQNAFTFQNFYSLPAVYIDLFPKKEKKPTHEYHMCQFESPKISQNSSPLLQLLISVLQLAAAEVLALLETTSAFQYMAISCAIRVASFEAPNSPFLVNPTAYRPFSPFQPLGKGLLGNPSSAKNCRSLSHKGTLLL